MNIIHRMKEEGFHRTAASYNPLLFTYKTFKEMKRVLDLMERDDVEPNIITFQMMVRGLARVAT